MYVSELHHVKNLSGHSCTQDTHSMPSRIPVRTGGVTVRPLAQARICSATEQSKRVVVPQGATEQSLRAVVPQESHSVPSIYKHQLQVCAIICLCLAKY